jgi:hypothetical protein
MDDAATAELPARSSLTDTTLAEADRIGDQIDQARAELEHPR